jgi:adenine-specific DNA-methyltransferase
MNKQDLISKIKQLDGISQDERAYLINLVNTKKKYGLVWEDKPEDAEEQLRDNLPVFKEVKEKAILASSKIPETEIATPTLFNKSSESPELDLGSDSIGWAIKNEAPNHILIEGDNLHALTALTFTHEGKIDVIYIDPPYNTKNKDFKYNDTFVDYEDSYRHSKWLSFMDKRLRIAKRLLSETGVIFISIDDNENAQLKLLCDEVFNQKNFISNIVWAAGKKNDSKHISNSHEYIICYFKNIDFIKENKIIWREKKEGIDRIYKTAKNLVKKHSNDFELATLDLKKWFKELSNNDPAKAHSHYSIIDENGVFFPDNISWPGGGGPKYDVLHPLTKKPVAIPSRGWVYSSIERMQEIINEGKVFFGKDEKSVPTLKAYLKDREFQVPYSVLYQDGRASTKRLMEMFGYLPFGNPKDENIISKLLQTSSFQNSTILDFFAGSGTTLHATMQLNAEDGGNRQCILITNNEIDTKTEKELLEKGIEKGTEEFEAFGICQSVTYERNKRVIQGYTNAKGIAVAGLENNNLRYYKSEFVPSSKTEQNKRLLTQTSTELLCIKEDCYTDLTESEGFNPSLCKIFTNGNSKYLVVVFHSRQINTVCAELVQFIKGLDTSEKVKLYAFSPEKETLLEDFYEVKDKIDAVPLPEAIYNAYRATFRTLKLDKKPMTVATPTDEIDEEIVLFENQDVE